MTPILAIDLSFLAHQARMTLRDLSTSDDVPSGIVYGILSRILSLGIRFRTNRIVFCCDGMSQSNPRRTILPSYKLLRQTNRTPKEMADLQPMYAQVHRLRTALLPLIGFQNVFWDGVHEADDFFGRIAETARIPVIMVANDGDLFQLLRQGMIMMWNPSTKKMTTEETFREMYPGIGPQEWARAKSIAGCDGDEVPGVDGVGYKTAVKYLLQRLEPSSKVYQAIASPSGAAIMARNWDLVKLPYPTTPAIGFVSNSFSMEGLMKVCVEYDIASFMEPDNMVRWSALFDSNWNAIPPSEPKSEKAHGRVTRRG